MHKMILATADLSTIYKVVVARRKDNASEVRQDEHCPRSAEVDGSRPSRSSNSNSIWDKWQDTFERLTEID